ncbi:hypothetical protein [Streptomyces sp. NPDC006334]
MSAGAYAHPAISRSATADGLLRLGGPPAAASTNNSLPRLVRLSG